VNQHRVGNNGHMTSVPLTPVAGDRRAQLSKGERQRRAILDALPPLLSKQPLSSLSVSDITKAAGLSRSGFYFYFDTKETALTVAVADVWSELKSRSGIWRPALQGDSLHDHVRRSLSTTAEVWRNHAELLIAFTQVRDIDPSMEAMWAESMQEFTTQLSEYIRLECDLGRAEPVSSDYEDLAGTLLHATADAFYRAVRAGSDQQEMNRHVDLLTRMFLAAIWGPRSGLWPAVGQAPAPR
jgi:TetR/AcrR family transcriptional regulator, ethionamide resistance regulator